MNNYYSFLSQLTVPKQPNQIIENHSKIKCTTNLQEGYKIERQVIIFKDASTQYEEKLTSNEATQYENQTVESHITYTNDLLSQMQSVDIDTFQPRKAESIQKQDYSIKDFVLSQTQNQTTEQYRNTIDQYIEQLQQMKGEIFTTQSIVEKMNNLSFSDQTSPGWIFTPTLKVAQSFSEDSLIEQ